MSAESVPITSNSKQASTNCGKIDNNDDDWHKVQDARERKKIQDRLAQRARRKRLREAKKGASDTTSATQQTCWTLSPVGPQNVQPRSSTQEPSDLDMIPFGFYSDMSESASSASSSSLTLSGSSTCLIAPSYRNPSPSTRYPFPLTVYSALYLNGKILGLSCSTSVPAKSKPAADDTPLPLHPTATQLLTVHSGWIDRFPFPKMRDNAITMGGIIDDEEFLYDMAVMPSFTLRHGCASWDPRGWKIEKPFVEKWGYLFF